MVTLRRTAFPRAVLRWWLGNHRESVEGEVVRAIEWKEN